MCARVRALVLLLPLTTTTMYIRGRQCLFQSTGATGWPGLQRCAVNSTPPPRQGSDVRTDLPLYHVYVDGETKVVSDISPYWREDNVTFYLGTSRQRGAARARHAPPAPPTSPRANVVGCSFSFEQALVQAGVPVRNAEQGRNVSMYRSVCLCHARPPLSLSPVCRRSRASETTPSRSRTNRACEPSGPFQGSMVVSMRPVPEKLVPRALAATSPHVLAHGGPIHCGDPAALGIAVGLPRSPCFPLRGAAHSPAAHRRPLSVVTARTLARRILAMPWRLSRGTWRAFGPAASRPTWPSAAPSCPMQFPTPPATCSSPTCR